LEGINGQGHVGNEVISQACEVITESSELCLSFAFTLATPAGHES